jgi:hypothetical protein
MGYHVWPSNLEVAMASVALHPPLSGFSQLQQFCTAVGSLLGSVCQSTDSAFRRVYVKKKDENGNIKLYNKKVTEKNPVTGQTKIVKKKIDTLTYIEDVKTGAMYKDEPSSDVAYKCFAITLGIPYYTVGQMVWHAVKTPIEIGAIALKTIFKSGQQILLGKFCESAHALLSACTQIPNTFGNGLFEVVKAPLFGLGCALSAITGMFKNSYHARKFEALIENAWQQGASYKQDFRNIPARKGEGFWTAFVKDILEPRPFYLAYCFQVRSNVNDPRVIVIRRERL